MQNSSKYALVVDDDPTMQLVLQSMVEKAGYKAAIADNGEKALQFLEVGQGNFSVVLLDQNLPDMSGMDVVKAIHEREGMTGIPVVMQSGSTDPKQIRSAIEGGVYSYLSKPFPIEALQIILDLALTKSTMMDVLNDRVAQRYAPVNLIRSAAFTMKSLDDARSLSILLSTLFPEPQEILPGLLAVMKNSIEHGLLGFGHEGKAEHIKKGTLIRETHRLQALKKNQTKEVDVQFVHKEGRISIRISDPGCGFDWKEWVAFKAERKSFTNGCGIIKALQSFDEVKYNTAGNQVMVSVFE